MKKLFGFGVGLFSVLLSGGCSLSMKPDFSASGLGQYSNPSTIVDLRKGKIEISASANGELNLEDVTISKDGTLHVKGYAKFQSNPETVVDAEGRRMPGTVLAGTQLAMADLAWKLDQGLTERHRIAGQNIEKVFNGMALAATAGGDAVTKWIDATAPVLRGSGLTLEGIGAANLGVPAQPTVLPEEPVEPVAPSPVKVEPAPGG